MAYDDLRPIDKVQFANELREPQLEKSIQMGRLPKTSIQYLCDKLNDIEKLQRDDEDPHETYN